MAARSDESGVCSPHHAAQQSIRVEPAQHKPTTAVNPGSGPTHSHPAERRLVDRNSPGLLVISPQHLMRNPRLPGEAARRPAALHQADAAAPGARGSLGDPGFGHDACSSRHASENLFFVVAPILDA